MRLQRIKWATASTFALSLLLFASACGNAGHAGSTPLATDRPVVQTQGSAGVTRMPLPTSRADSPGGDAPNPQTLEKITGENVSRLASLADIGEGDLMADLDASPDGKLLAVAARGGVILLDVESGGREGFIHIPGAVENLDISPDGELMAVVYRVAGAKTVQNVYQGEISVEEPHLAVFRVADRTVLFSKNLAEMGCADSIAWNVRFSPDRQVIALRGSSGIYTDERGAPHRYEICLLSSAEGDLVRAISIDSTIDNHTSLLFSPDGRRLLAAANDPRGETTRVRAYDTTSGQIVQEYDGQGGTIQAIDLSPDGQWLALANENGVLVFSVDTPSTPVLINGQGRAIQSLAFSPDGKSLAMGTRDGRISLWQFPEGSLLWENPAITLLNLKYGDQAPGISRLVFAPDGGKLFCLSISVDAYTTNLVQVLRAADGREVNRIYGRNSLVAPRLSPDGSQVAFGGYQDGQVQIWSVSRNEAILELQGHAGMVMDAVFSPDGSRVATASLDGRGWHPACHADWPQRGDLAGRVFPKWRPLGFGR